MNCPDVWLGRFLLQETVAIVLWRKYQARELVLNLWQFGRISKCEVPFVDQMGFRSCEAFWLWLADF
jgi:hypothetical protein